MLIEKELSKMMSLENKGIKREIVQLKKELSTIKKRKEDSSTIETKYDKYGNKVIMNETVK